MVMILQVFATCSEGGVGPSCGYCSGLYRRPKVLQAECQWAFVSILAQVESGHVTRLGEMTLL
jgi:hypothetical protein